MQDVTKIYPRELSVIRPQSGKGYQSTDRAFDERAPPDGFRLRGTIEVVQPDFAHHTWLVYLRTGTLTCAAISQLELPLKIGAEIDVIFPTHKFYFFDGETEERIK